MLCGFLVATSGKKIAKESVHLKLDCDDDSPDVAIIAKNSNIDVVHLYYEDTP